MFVGLRSTSGFTGVDEVLGEGDSIGRVVGAPSPLEPIGRRSLQRPIAVASAQPTGTASERNRQSDTCRRDSMDEGGFLRT